MIDDDDDRGDRHSDIANERVRKSEKNQTKIEKKIHKSMFLLDI